MPIISAIDNENNRWKSKKQKKNNKGKKEGAGAIVKEWALKDFFVRLSKVFSNQYVKLLQFLSRI